MLQQEYKHYTEEDFKVWRILYERQMINLQDTVTNRFLEGLKKINFTPDKIPNFEETNKLLEELTGWHIQAVPGIISDKNFFELLSQKKFPATFWLRKMSQLDYLEEPDMFHDVFGHIPLLTNQSYCNFLLGLSTMAWKYLEDAEIIELMSRLYWFTIEFGLINENNQTKIYGAGIISSSDETKYSLSDKPIHLLFNMHQILETSFYKDHIQEKYFVVNSFDELYHCLPALEKELEIYSNNKGALKSYFN